ncbi:MAG: molybdenum cofactor guanylyltransferase [Saprospiraceae bacterium]|nr:molybdenum cofactor guanylyltransferase [Saprospiraceae bacterium]
MDNNPFNISCAIMAGGKNSRLGGKNKAFIKLNGKTIIENTIEKIDNIFSEIIIITNSPSDYDQFTSKCKIFTDEIKNVGPLGGIYTALNNITYQAVFIISCDMPFLDTEIIEKQIIDYENNKCCMLVPRINNNIEPLHTIYKKSILKKLKTHLETTENYSIRSFFPLINLRYFDLENNSKNQKAFTNINTTVDLKNIEDNL